MDGSDTRSAIEVAYRAYQSWRDVTAKVGGSFRDINPSIILYIVVTISKCGTGRDHLAKHCEGRGAR